MIRIDKVCTAVVWLALAGLPSAGMAQMQSPAEQGIPVTDALVIAKCGSCHTSDARGNMERVSWSRATPEGWQDILKDMIVMNGLSVTPEEARPIVKYLSTAHGLAPGEAKPVMYEPERRVREENNLPTDTLREACTKCHNFARPLSWRRSPAEWKAFDDSHAKRYKYKANAEAVTFLSGAAALHTAEWDSWMARKETPEPTGRWLVTASLRGHGKYYGEMQVDPAADGFATRVNLTSVRDGSKVARTGRGVLYGGTAWRGRSGGTVPPNAPADDPSSDMREVMWFSADHLNAEGRWFWGQYQEFGFDVQLRRPWTTPAPGPTPETVLLTVDRLSLKPRSRANRIRLIGENLPAKVAVGDVRFGPGVTVRTIVSHSAREVVVDVDVAADAPPGKRGITLGKAVLPDAITIYDRVDYMVVTPESAMAAFGDQKHPRGYQQFEAIGYQRGPDGRAHTADDVELGPIDVSWSLDVFHAPEGSSDFVGKMSPTGLLSPSASSPDNNFDVWVTARARDEKGADGELLSGKAYVVVTVPTYAFNGRQYVRDLARWVDDGPAAPGTRPRR